jgi:hypothetical protein
MGVAAVIFALLTVLVGTTVLADFSGPSMPRSLRPMVSSHVAVALAGAGALAVAVVGSSSSVAWVSLAVLVLAASLGGALYKRSARLDPGTTRVSRRLLVVHGGAAALTGLFALLAAGRVGR